jgi:tol-pal system protein YbgF
LFLGAALLAGAVGGVLFSPAPAGAVNKEMIELQQTVNQVLQAQKAMQSAMDEKFAVLKTLVEQANDANSKLSTSMGSLQKTVQDTQAVVGARMDTMATQVQGLSDNLDETKQRLGKINQQLTDVQSTLQSIDGKLAAMASPAANSSAPSGGAGSAPAGGSPTPPPPPDVLYQNALRDHTSGNYDLARQEFQDYLKFYPTTDLASNAQFYLGEISFVQKQFKQAIEQYDMVMDNYPKSFKLSTARYKKGMALLALGQKTAAIREFREVIRRHPNSDEDKRSRDQLRQLGASVTAPR